MNPIFRQSICAVVIVSFTMTMTPPLHAQEALILPNPGVRVSLSPEFTPAHLKGITIHQDNALRFDFLVHKGDKPLADDAKKEEYNKLIKYFLASLTIADKDQWVNLSPYEKDRIIEGNFGKTEMGRDLLGQDYLLKQITASLIYPEEGLGQKFWDTVYQRAFKEYGTTEIPVNTFNKVWIIPDKAVVYESGNTAYILQSHLKVMLEEDYLSLEKHSSSVIPAKAGIQKDDNQAHTLGSQVVREIVLPALEKEVNEGKNFAQLRQIYSAMILATWYKKALKASLLGQVYADKAKVKGVDQDPKANEVIYQQYLKAFKKGVYNYIKEDTDKYTKQTIPRKYFSGGMTVNDLPKTEQVLTAESPELKTDPSIVAAVADGATQAVLGRDESVETRLDTATDAQQVIPVTVKKPGARSDAAMTTVNHTVETVWQKLNGLGNIDAIKAMSIEEFARSVGVHVISHTGIDRPIFTLSGDQFEKIRIYRETGRFPPGTSGKSLQALAANPEINEAGIYLSPQDLEAMHRRSDFRYNKGSIVHELMEEVLSKPGSRDEVLLLFRQHAQARVLQEEMLFNALMGPDAVEEGRAIYVAMKEIEDNLLSHPDEYFETARARYVRGEISRKQLEDSLGKNSPYYRTLVWIVTSKNDDMLQKALQRWDAKDFTSSVAGEDAAMLTADQIRQRLVTIQRQITAAEAIWANATSRVGFQEPGSSEQRTAHFEAQQAQQNIIGLEAQKRSLLAELQRPSASNNPDAAMVGEHLTEQYNKRKYFVKDVMGILKEILDYWSKEDHVKLRGNFHAGERLYFDLLPQFSDSPLTPGMLKDILSEILQKRRDIPRGNPFDPVYWASVDFPTTNEMTMPVDQHSDTVILQAFKDQVLRIIREELGVLERRYDFLSAAPNVGDALSYQSMVYAESSGKAEEVSREQHWVPNGAKQTYVPVHFTRVHNLMYVAVVDSFSSTSVRNIFLGYDESKALSILREAQENFVTEPVGTDIKERALQAIKKAAKSDAAMTAQEFVQAAEAGAVQRDAVIDIALTPEAAARYGESEITNASFHSIGTDGRIFFYPENSMPEANPNSLVPSAVLSVIAHQGIILPNGHFVRGGRKNSSPASPVVVWPGDDPETSRQMDEIIQHNIEYFQSEDFTHLMTSTTLSESPNGPMKQVVIEADDQGRILSVFSQPANFNPHSPESRQRHYVQYSVGAGDHPISQFSGFGRVHDVVSGSMDVVSGYLQKVQVVHKLVDMAMMVLNDDQLSARVAAITLSVSSDIKIKVNREQHSLEIQNIDQRFSNVTGISVADNKEMYIVSLIDGQPHFYRVYILGIARSVEVSETDIPGKVKKELGLVRIMSQERLQTRINNVFPANSGYSATAPGNGLLVFNNWKFHGDFSNVINVSRRFVSTWPDGHNNTFFYIIYSSDGLVKVKKISAFERSPAINQDIQLSEIEGRILNELDLQSCILMGNKSVLLASMINPSNAVSNAATPGTAAAPAGKAITVYKGPLYGVADGNEEVKRRAREQNISIDAVLQGLTRSYFEVANNLQPGDVVLTDHGVIYYTQSRTLFNGNERITIVGLNDDGQQVDMLYHYVKSLQEGEQVTPSDVSSTLSYSKVVRFPDISALEQPSESTSPRGAKSVSRKVSLDNVQGKALVDRVRALVDEAMTINRMVVAKNSTDVGGIDLNSANLDLQIKRDGKGVPLPLQFQDMEKLRNIQGFVPVIINIVPVTSLPFLSELQHSQPAQVTAQAT